MRLTNHIRESICREVIRSRFDQPFKDLVKEEVKFGVTVYNNVYPTELQEKMAALPKGFLPERSYLRVQFGSEFTHVELGSDRRVSDYNIFNGGVFYGNDHPLMTAFWELRKKRKDLESQRSQARRDVMAVLDSVSTPKRLLEVWPEVEPFVRPYLGTPTPQTTALTVSISSLNASLGLPPK